MLHVYLEQQYKKIMTLRMYIPQGHSHEVMEELLLLLLLLLLRLLRVMFLLLSSFYAQLLTEKRFSMSHSWLIISRK